MQNGETCVKIIILQKKKKKNCSKVLQREENDIEIPKTGYHLHEIYISTRAFTY